MYTWQYSLCSISTGVNLNYIQQRKKIHPILQTSCTENFLKIQHTSIYTHLRNQSNSECFIFCMYIINVYNVYLYTASACFGLHEIRSQPLMKCYRLNEMVAKLTLGYFMVKWLSRFSSNNGSTPISGFMTDTPERLSS